jgi:hypothetical protein
MTNARLDKVMARRKLIDSVIRRVAEFVNHLEKDLRSRQATFWIYLKHVRAEPRETKRVLEEKE